MLPDQCAMTAGVYRMGYDAWRYSGWDVDRHLSEVLT